MSEFFLAVVNMSISASWIVLAVLILRLLLKKAPKWITVLLWGIVAVRLICPFSIESVMSLIPSAETINPEILVEQAPVINPSIPVMDGGVEDPVINGTNNGTDTPVPDTTPVDPVQTAIPVLSAVWLVGIAGMLAYTVISYFRVKEKIGTAVCLRDNIFQSERVVSPFVLGLIKPKIYLPFCIDGQDMEYVIAHENAHIHRKDHWWKPVGFLILTLHWFNPLLWLGYVLLCRDIELACDEKVVKELDFQQKSDYSQALLNCSVNRRIIAACPLAFGEVGIKERVKSVLSYKKPAFWIIVVAIVASIVTAVCFLTDPVKEDTEQFFSEGFLFFDIGAESMESIESCTIIHDGNPTELILSEEDTLLFSRYAYTNKVPVPELSEIFTYPKTKRIQIAVGDRIATLYLMQDGCITVNLPEKGFSMYQAEERDVITPEKYQQMIAKYTTPPDNTTEKFLKGEISATNKDGRKVSIQDYLRGDYNKYAVYDMSGDAVPELIIKTGEGLTIFSVKEQGLTVWYQGTIYEKPLNNRAIFYERPGGAPEHTDYQYIVLDHNGEELQRTSFAESYGDNAEYFINGEWVSKTAYEDLYKSFDLSDDAIVWKDILPVDSVYAEFLNGYATDKSLLYFTKDIDNNGTEELFIHQNTTMEVYTYENAVKKVGVHDFITGTLILHHTNDNKYPGIVFVTVEGGKEHFGYITITDGALSLQQTFDNDYGMISGKKEDIFYTDDEELIAISRKAYEEFYWIGYSVWEPKPTIAFQVNSSSPEYTAVVNYSKENPEAAQSVTITDLAAKKDIQTISLSGNELFTQSVIYAVDVTFDGNLDILIPHQRPASAAYFQAYVWQESESQFVYAPQFENLPNIIIDKESNRILSTRTASQITSYSISYYDAEAKDFRPSHSLYWEPDASNNQMHFVEQRYENGTAVTVKDCLVEKISDIDVNKSDPQIAEYFASNSFWGLDNQKWENQFYKPSQSCTTEGIGATESALLSVLQNKSPFIAQKGTTVYLNAYKPYYKHSEDTAYYEEENVFVPQDYTFVDLDKDGKKELIVAEAPYADTYLILREENGKIYGYSLPNRWFQSLKQDGSFQGSGGALIHDYSTISFSQNTYQMSTIAKFHFEADDKKPVPDKYGYAPDYEKSVFEINGKSVSFEEIEQFAEQWENRPGAVWMKLT